jgi:N-acetylglucosamine-6-phosphate deacetylase
MLVLTGARLFDGETFHDDAALVIEGSRIVALTSYAERPQGFETRDLGGGLLAPGFIDVQVNGGGGVLFNADPTADGVLKIAAAFRKFGTVGLMPTLVTDAPELMPRAIAAIKEARTKDPAVLGVHLEGPFLDPRRKGAHEARYIREITADDVELIASADCGAVMLTLAPNRVPVETIRALSERGVLVSLGHAEATHAQARAALAAGARAFTHLHNAMSPLMGREPGMVGAALTDSESFVGIIADGVHVHPATLQLSFAAKRRDRFMLITDAMPTAAGGPDRFCLQGRWIFRAEGCLTLEDGTLAGADITMDTAVRYAVGEAGVTLAEALIMASRTPAAFLRRGNELGRLAPGYLASLVHLDENLRVRETWVEGD